MFEVDTGAAITLISEETYREHFPNMPMHETSLRTAKISYKYWDMSQLM